MIIGNLVGMIVCNYYDAVLNNINDILPYVYHIKIRFHRGIVMMGSNAIDAGICNSVDESISSDNRRNIFFSSSGCLRNARVNRSNKMRILDCTDIVCSNAQIRKGNSFVLDLTSLGWVVLWRFKARLVNLFEFGFFCTRWNNSACSKVSQRILRPRLGSLELS